MRKRGVVAGSVVVVALVSGLALSGGASARRGVAIHNGPIAFSSNRDGDNEIFTMRPDGAHQAQLTHNSANDYAPAYSPDGTTIAFVSDVGGDYDIYSMSASAGRPPT